MDTFYRQQTGVVFWLDILDQPVLRKQRLDLAVGFKKIKVNYKFQKPCFFRSSLVEGTK